MKYIASLPFESTFRRESSESIRLTESGRTSDVELVNILNITSKENTTHIPQNSCKHWSHVQISLTTLELVVVLIIRLLDMQNTINLFETGLIVS